MASRTSNKPDSSVISGNRNAGFDARFRRTRLWVFLVFFAVGVYFFAWDKWTDNPVNLSGASFWIYGVSQIISALMSMGVLVWLSLLLVFPRLKDWLDARGRNRKNEEKNVLNRRTFFANLLKLLGYLSVGRWINMTAYALVYCSDYRKGVWNKGNETPGYTEVNVGTSEHRKERDALKNRLKKSWGRFREMLTVDVTEYQELFPNVTARKGDEAKCSIMFWILVSVSLAVGMIVHAKFSGYQFCWKGLLTFNERARIEAKVDAVGAPLRFANRLIRQNAGSGTKPFQFLIPDKTDIAYLIPGDSGVSPNEGENPKSVDESRVVWLWFLICAIIFYAVLLRVVFYALFSLLVWFAGREAGRNKAEEKEKKILSCKTDAETAVPKSRPVPVSAFGTAPDHLLVLGWGTELSSDLWAELLNHPNGTRFSCFGNMMREDVSAELESWLGERGESVLQAVLLVDTGQMPSGDFIEKTWNDVFDRIPGLGEITVLLSCTERIRSAGIPIAEKLTDWEKRISRGRCGVTDVCDDQPVHRFKISFVDWFDHEMMTAASRSKLARFFSAKFGTMFGAAESEPQSVSGSRFPLFTEQILRRAALFRDEMISRLKRTKGIEEFSSEEKEKMCADLFLAHLEAGKRELRAAAEAEESVFLRVMNKEDDSVSFADKLLKFGGKTARFGSDAVQGTVKLVGVIQSVNNEPPVKKAVKFWLRAFAAGAAKLCERKEKENPEEREAESRYVKNLCAALAETALIFELQGMPPLKLAERLKREIRRFNDTGLLFDLEEMKQIMSEIQLSLGEGE